MVFLGAGCEAPDFPVVMSFEKKDGILALFHFIYFCTLGTVRLHKIFSVKRGSEGGSEGLIN